MTRSIRLLLLFEAATFAAAASVHRGLFVSGYQHRQAFVAESVIAAVLLAGLAVTFIDPRRTRGVGLAAQAFALLGTAVGLFTVAIGVGPRTTPDLVYHAFLVAVLVWGLALTRRARANAPGAPA